MKVPTSVLQCLQRFVTSRKTNNVWSSGIKWSGTNFRDELFQFRNLVAMIQSSQVPEEIRKAQRRRRLEQRNTLLNLSDDMEMISETGRHCKYDLENWREKKASAKLLASFTGKARF